MPRKAARKGLLIQYEYCTGCHTCEVACKQEHNYPVGIGGIKLNEIITEKPDRIRIDYVPFLTEFCDLCAARTRRGEKPSCVKHCQAAIMWYGTVDELAKQMADKPRSVIQSPY
ncbi:MAG: oxidoreductase [Dehalococcoidia bacterium]|nr:oxidoreductase [Dehalococcoidia bacterium]